MACNVQDWSLKDLSDALNNKHIDKKRIAVPMFQRGTRWHRAQEEKFIDSLKSGFPVGTMLFYETIEDNQSVYLLVDGLQRGNTIRKYITKPTEFFSSETIGDEICSKLLIAMGEVPSIDGIEKARTILTEFIKAQQSYANLQYFNPAVELLKGFDKSTDVSLIGNLLPLLESYFKERQDRYTQIAQTIIPVVVYQGEATNLDEIFKRINSQGTPLDQYEVYAAAWPSNRIYHTGSADIVDAVIQKYDSMEAGDFEIYGYDSTKIKKDKNLTAFEYLFGLSKVLTQKVDILRFIKQGEIPDEVNPLGFELVNACLNDTNRIPELYKCLAAISDINQFEKALKNAISFVHEAVALITRFKGNNRHKDKIFHSKFQIMSMISTTFKEMYGNGNYDKVSEDWAAKKDEIARNLRQYYVYDILTNFWSEGLDVPDVNLIVFNRTTHSRRIFIQQLGRGLRLAEDKSKVVVLDFVSDIRRIAEGISLKKSLATSSKLVSINHSVTFRREGGDEDPRHEAFLRGWLDDILNVKDANDEWKLRFPPL